MSSGRSGVDRPRVLAAGLGEQVVDLAGDEAFEAADDVFLGEALLGASFDVGNGRWVPAHSDDHDPVEGGVGLAVAATIETMPAGSLAGTSRNRASTAEFRERSLGVDSVGVVASGDEHFRSGVEPDPEPFEEFGSGSLGECFEPGGVDLDLFVQSEPTRRETRQRDTHRDPEVAMRIT